MELTNKKLKLIVLFIGLVIALYSVIFFSPQAFTPVTGNYERLDGVTWTYDSGSNTATWNNQWASGFLFSNDGYGYLDYDGAGTLGNGLLPDGHYAFQSTNSRYSLLEIGPLQFNIYQYIYEFEFIKTASQITMYNNYSNDPLWDNDFVFAFNANQQDYMYIRILDNDATALGVYTQGYNDGYINGQDNSKFQYGYLNDGVWTSALDWGNIRYNEGLGQGTEDALAIRNMIPGVMGVFIAFFFQIASIEVLGISALDIIALIFGVAVTLFLIRVFINR
jgi:hypothetical protein